jgi:hypothetical protein
VDQGVLVVPVYRALEARHEFGGFSSIQVDVADPCKIYGVNVASGGG